MTHASMTSTLFFTLLATSSLTPRSGSAAGLRRLNSGFWIFLSVAIFLFGPYLAKAVIVLSTQPQVGYVVRGQPVHPAAVFDPASLVHQRHIRGNPAGDLATASNYPRGDLTITRSPSFIPLPAAGAG